ncbi:MAG: RraA family protein [Firmicutes bacterium]|nr:RraA family protein [Bacillota bacterium]
MSEPPATKEWDAQWGRVGRALGEYSVATLHEAAEQKGALPAAIKPLSVEWKLCGPAYPVSCAPRDNLWLHRAIYAAPPGAVLVAETGGFYEAGYWGEVMTIAAMERRLGGLVLDGAVRDLARLLALGFPIFARGVHILGTAKDPEARGGLNVSIRLGSVVVRPGDWVVGDADGVVVVYEEDLETVVERAKQREDKEQEVIRRLRRGESTLSIYHLDP